jgi:cytoskeletal protein CcmA (bactofilin family)
MSTTNNQLTTNKLTFIHENVIIEGKVHLVHTTYIHGTVKGEIHGSENSTIILTETSVVEGKIFAETLYVCGFVHGEIYVTNKVTLKATSRVIGTIKTNALQLETGAYFEGSCNSNPTSK